MNKQVTPATGEYGFCPRCGEVAEVVVTAKDRLRFRLVRAATIKAARVNGVQGNPLQRLRHHLTGMLMSGAAAQALSNYGLVGGDPQRNSRSAVIELRRRMQEVMQELVIAEANLAAWLDTPVDLLREATEELEKETDFRKARDEG